MPLGRERIRVQGDTPYAHEREGIAFVEERLPNNDPYFVWELVELIEPSTGRQYEIDLLVLGFSCMYLLELKGGPGRYTGDSLDWQRHPPGERAHYMEPPIKGANLKCKVLKSLLQRHAKGARDLIPRIEPLVFLSHQDVQLDLRADGMVGVVTRHNVYEALTRHRFPGSPPNWRGLPIRKPAVRAVLDATQAAGIAERKGRQRVGPYQLGELLRDGEAYQDHVATRDDLPGGLRRRARVYLVPQQTSVERRKRLRRAAEREASLLIDVRGSRFVLGCTEYFADGPRGPTVLFEDFEGGQPLESFLRAHVLDPDAKLELVRQLAQALGHCHQRGIVHGAVSPDAVLAKLNEAGKPELRLYNFQLASSEGTTGTVHATAFGHDAALIYQAPELREDPSLKSEVADVYGLGAVAYRIFIGEPPGASGAEVDKRLRADRGLDPRGYTEQAVDAELADILKFATALTTVERADSAMEWFDLLEERLTSPESTDAKSTVSPLEAVKGDVLDGDLLVHSLLGEGASSRVLRVLRDEDNREYALKVSLNEAQDPRLRAEAKVLEKLRHPRIVPLVEQRVIGERVCLLLGLAGSHTLQRELAQEGSVSLEYAARYGEDLLTALELLEEHSFIHRDIKPANLGVGAAGKRKKHLTLLDFSLAEAPLTELGVGTALYRDPFLRDRGQWDTHADHYSAAVTLHEMLTGSRARWGDAGVPALDERATLKLQPARFDAAIRDQLVEFFERALARDAKQRFGSATAMRKAWERAFEEPRRRSSRPPALDEQVHGAEGAELAGPLYTQETLAALPLDAPLEALPLSTRARNALDRAGVSHAEQALALPDNRLSVIRGAGRKVQQEIHDFREALASVHAHHAETESFYPAYRGEDRALEAVDLAPELIASLRDAGLRSLSAVAAASKEQVVELARRAKCPTGPLRSLLQLRHKEVDAREHPVSVEDWLAALLPRSGRQREYLECLLGLRSPFEGQLDVPATRVAKHYGVTAPNLYIALTKARERWAQHPALQGLVEPVQASVQAAGGALPVRRAARLLLEALPHAPETTLELKHAQAAALVRVAAEVITAQEGPLRYVRLAERGPWVLEERVQARQVIALGEAADAIAAREVPPSPAEAARRLALAVEGSPLALVAPDQLIQMACAAAKQAACSARLEVYPRGLEPARALALTAGVLKGELDVAAIRQRVGARYPEAALLPERPELDGLLAPFNLSWDEATGRYLRKGDQSPTSLRTRTGSLGSRLHTAPTGLPRSDSAEALTARDFDDKLRAALEADAFRVLGVSVRGAPVAVEILRQRHELTVHAFDALFATGLKKLTASGRPSLDLVVETDAAGPESKPWKNLCKVAASVADEMLETLVPAAAPCVITQLGLAARYGLREFLAELVERAGSPQSRSVLLLVPCPDTGSAPRIENRFTIAGLLPGQTLWIPGAWLKNAHNAAA